jgi:hypothetical protein
MSWRDSDRWVPIQALLAEPDFNDALQAVRHRFNHTGAGRTFPCLTDRKTA